MTLLSSKSIVALGVIAFLAMSFWGLSSMSMDMSGRMFNCPFMHDASSFCQMNVSEHINQWRQFFAVIIKNNLTSSLFVLLTYILVISIFLRKNISKTNQYQLFRSNFYQYKPEINLFNKINLAFSKGIIHPQIYA